MGKVSMKLVKIGIQTRFSEKNIFCGRIKDQVIRVLLVLDGLRVRTWFSKVSGEQGRLGS